jgi:ribosomal protein S18 acetylase RimI-like enzyme
VLGAAGGIVETTEELDGVAVWAAPTRAVDAAVSPRAVAGVMLRARLSLPRLRAYLEHNARMKDEVHPAPCVVLSGIGVHPALQGHGIGSALLESGLRRADEDGSVVFLGTNTARNLPLYERHGFEVVAESPVPGGGPPTWVMLRRP